MKYLGEGSLSSFLKGFFHIGFYAAIVIAVVCLSGSYLLIAPNGDPMAVKIAGALNLDLGDPDMVAFKNWPMALKLLVVPYFAALAFLLLSLIKKAESLLGNFNRDVVFHRGNVELMAVIGRLMIWFSILTFNVSALLASFLLLLLCEIFKHGAALQEEHDFTV